jgi:hypothetical protein
LGEGMLKKKWALVKQQQQPNEIFRKLNLPRSQIVTLHYFRTM